MQKIDPKNTIIDLLFNLVLKQVGEQMMDQVWAAIRNPVGTVVAEQLRSRVWEEVKDQVYEQAKY